MFRSTTEVLLSYQTATCWFRWPWSNLLHFFREKLPNVDTCSFEDIVLITTGAILNCVRAVFPKYSTLEIQDGYPKWWFVKKKFPISNLRGVTFHQLKEWLEASFPSHNPDPKNQWMVVSTHVDQKKMIFPESGNPNFGNPTTKRVGGNPFLSNHLPLNKAEVDGILHPDITREMAEWQKCNPGKLQIS